MTGITNAPIATGTSSGSNRLKKSTDAFFQGEPKETGGIIL